MSNFGKLYSSYYDLLYKDKDYSGEVDYILQLMDSVNTEGKNILDLGCGTGMHADLLAKKGYRVHGVDLSDEMLAIAREKESYLKGEVEFSQSDVTKLNLNKKFDTVVSLFHVMSYMRTNEDLHKAFQTAYNHLSPGGIFIFDFWYGPAVLSDPPAVRIKNLENDNFKITRLSEPALCATEDAVDLTIKMFIKNKQTSEIHEKEEDHKLRYLFDKELELTSDKVGFKIERKNAWMTNTRPDYKSWYVVWTLRKV